MATGLIKTKHLGVYYKPLEKNDKSYYIKYQFNGKTKSEKVGLASQGMTVAFAKDIRSKRILGNKLDDKEIKLIGGVEKTRVSFGEAFKMYMEKIKGKSDAVNIQARYDNHLKKDFENLFLDEITTETIEKFKNKSKEKINIKTGKLYAPKTTNDWLDIIGTIFNFMINQHDLNIKNPATANKVEREKVHNDRERYLEENEVWELWENLENRQGKEDVTYRLKLFLALSLSTGARLGSVLTIKKSDINLNQNTIRITNHKAGGRIYTGYLHPFYKDLIESRMKSLRPTDYIISGTPKIPHRTTINKGMVELLAPYNEGLETDDRENRVVIHTLRHTFASLLAIQGTPIYTIMKLMDHADITQTIRYAKLSPENGFKNVATLPFGNKN